MSVVGPAEPIERSPIVRSIRAALPDGEAWIVGGSVRDVALGRALEDVDLVVTGDPERAARALARSSDAHVFPLSEEFGAWRVTPKDDAWQADLSPLRGDHIESDLGLRDFTVNAMAVPMSEPVLVDPYGGIDDIDARRLRVVSDSAYRDDPLRTLRMARFVCELGFEVDPHTLELAAQAADQIGVVASERVFYELRRVICSDAPLEGIEMMDRAGLMDRVLPELTALKGVEQNRYHQHDVWGHTLEVLRQLLEIEREPEAALGELGAAVGSELGLRLADELSRGQALRFAALFHDLGKPATRSVNDDGRVLFWGHDELGARMSSDICRRLHASSALGDYLAGIARHHLRAGFLVHARPLSRRDIYRYIRSCEPVELEVTVLSIADRLATTGPKTKQAAIQGHLEVARDLVAAALDWRRRGPGQAPIGGHELMQELDLQPGPEVGKLLEAIREGVYAGEIVTRDQALEVARAELEQG